MSSGRQVQEKAAVMFQHTPASHRNSWSRELQALSRAQFRPSASVFSNLKRQENGITESHYMTMTHLGHVVVTMWSHCSQSTSVPFCLTLTKMCLQLLPPLDRHHSAQLELLADYEDY